jgi:hypothetical protein
MKAAVLGTLSLSTLALADDLHCTDQCLRSERPGDRPIMATNGAMARKHDFWTHMKVVCDLFFTSPVTLTYFFF